jgi:hypothetical protein
MAHDFQINDFVVVQDILAYDGVAGLFRQYGVRPASTPYKIVALINGNIVAQFETRGVVVQLDPAYVTLRFRPPVQPGDSVVLVKTPEISGDVRPGWRGSEHFLVQGAGAVVADVGRDSAGLQFNQESWVDSQGIQHLMAPERRGIFYFPYTDFVKVGT